MEGVADRCRLSPPRRAKLVRQYSARRGHALKIAIIGAGPMGLVCALELLNRGESVDIYENDDRIGGMSASFDFDGLPIERFYHFICKTDAAIIGLLGELGLSERLRWTDTRMGVYCDGRLYD